MGGGDAWRPEAFSTPLRLPHIAGVAGGTSYGRGLKVFHDGHPAEVTLDQSDRQDLMLAVTGFSGSYASLAVEVPGTLVAGLGQDHIVQIDLDCGRDAASPACVRLNVEHGPNLAVETRPLPADPGWTATAFDLTSLRFNPRRVVGAWIDIVWSAPPSGTMILRDVAVSRRRRAGF